MASIEHDLTGRRARCAYYGQPPARRGSYGGGNECNYGQSTAPKCTCEQPSAKDLPFFEFCGEGSQDATHCKHCGYYEVAHHPINPLTGRPNNLKCKGYEPRGGAQFDRFYCGCHGWD